MLNNQFFDLSLSIQVALGAGYLGYVTAYAGFRRDHRVEDVLFISLAFAAVAMLTFGFVEQSQGVFAAALLAFGSSLALAALWRKWGRRAWLWATTNAGIHRDDGSHDAWSQIVQTDLQIGQVSVHMKDGRVLYLSDRRKYENSPWKGLYLGGNGAVVMVVEKEKDVDGLITERNGIADPEWGTRLTYLPASEIQRVNIRMK